MPQAVSNASPLLYLHRLGRLDLLRALHRSVIVPVAVFDELAAGASLGVDVPDVARLDWIEVRAPSEAALSRVSPRLHRGERAALALALDLRDAMLVVDDGDARRQAAVLGLRVIGTLGVLVLAKHAGHVTQVAPLLDALV